jgi:hypothetical protein
MIFSSEYGEDAWIDQHLTLPATGFFVDIGCALPNQCSNTAFLRAKGWTGLAIDGADYKGAWAGTGVRFVCAVLDEQPGTAFFANQITVPKIVAPGDGLAAEKRETTTLDSILQTENVEQIDFLSIDIEGHEYVVMKSLNLNRFRPGVIVAEYNTGGIGTDYRLRDHLVNSGKYNVVHQTIANFIYTRVA